MATLAEGIETVFGDYKIRIVQLETDRPISVLHVPSRSYVFHGYVPAGFRPLPGAYAPEEECMKYAIEQALRHVGRDDDAAAISTGLKWERGSFPRPEMSR